MSRNGSSSTAPEIPAGERGLGNGPSGIRVR